jgi:hypothetical protein
MVLEVQEQNKIYSRFKIINKKNGLFKIVNIEDIKENKIPYFLKFYSKHELFDIKGID